MKALFVFQLVSFAFALVWASDPTENERTSAVDMPLATKRFTETDSEQNPPLSYIIQFKDSDAHDSAIRESAEADVNGEIVSTASIPAFNMEVFDFASTDVLENWLSNRNDVEAFFEDGLITVVEEGKYCIRYVCTIFLSKLCELSLRFCPFREYRCGGRC